MLGKVCIIYFIFFIQFITVDKIFLNLCEKDSTNGQVEDVEKCGWNYGPNVNVEEDEGVGTYSKMIIL